MPEEQGQFRPHLQALLLCQRVEMTGVVPRATLTGIFTHIEVPLGHTSLPTVIVYILLWGLDGPHEIELEWRKQKADRTSYVLASMPVTLEGWEPPRPFEFASGMPGLPIDGPGWYEMRLTLDGRLLGQAFVSLVLFVDGATRNRVPAHRVQGTPPSVIGQGAQRSGRPSQPRIKLMHYPRRYETRR